MKLHVASPKAYPRASEFIKKVRTSSYSNLVGLGTILPRRTWQTQRNHSGIYEFYNLRRQCRSSFDELRDILPIYYLYFYYNIIDEGRKVYARWLYVLLNKSYISDTQLYI